MTGTECMVSLDPEKSVPNTQCKSSLQFITSRFRLCAPRLYLGMRLIINI